MRSVAKKLSGGPTAPPEQQVSFGIVDTLRLDSVSAPSTEGAWSPYRWASLYR